MKINVFSCYNYSIKNINDIHLGLHIYVYRYTTTTVQIRDMMTRNVPQIAIMMSICESIEKKITIHHLPAPVKGTQSVGADAHQI